MDGIGFKVKSMPRGAHFKKIGGCRTRKTAHQQTDRETIEPERTKVHSKRNPNFQTAAKCTRRRSAKPHSTTKPKSKNRLQEVLPRRNPSSKETNDDLTESFIAQLKSINLKTAEVTLLRRINTEATSINKVINGIMETNVKICNKPLESLREEGPSNPKELKVDLIPRSQWVYETPDKQRMKRMDELNFNEVKPALEPAVFQTTDKIVYGLNDKMSNMVDLTQFHPGQEVPINRAFLTPINVNKSPTEENQFLTQNELTINIDENTKNLTNSRKRRHEGDDELNWYEKHMKTLATCRPVKERADRRNYVLRKSLSFQEETPTSHSRMKSRFRSLDETESYRSHTEDECSLLDEDFYTGEDFLPEEPVPPNSPQLSLILGNVYINSFNEIPAPKFYPRRNYD